jgi:hypothetical protein
LRQRGTETKRHRDRKRQTQRHRDRNTQRQRENERDRGVDRNALIQSDGHRLRQSDRKT